MSANTSSNQIKQKNSTRNSIFTMIPAATWMGLLLVIFGNWALAVISKLPSLVEYFSAQAVTIVALLLVWLLTACLLILVKRLENRPLTSIGLHPITFKETLLAVALGLVLSLSVPLLTWLANLVIPPTKEGSMTELTTTTPWLLLLFGGVVTPGFVEETLYRGYVLERIREHTGSLWLAVTVSVIAFVLPHTPGWNLSHVIGVVLPLGLAMSWIYVWKRNLIFTMIVHAFVNLPMVFIALGSG